MQTTTSDEISGRTFVILVPKLANLSTVALHRELARAGVSRFLPKASASRVMNAGRNLLIAVLAIGPSAIGQQSH